VHEIGLMFLVFMPVPYVDASDAMSFPEKWRRALVGGAGILVELFVAALALIVWIGAEPGLVRAFAFNVMLIGGISTLVFNGNPLLRFDGYYVLSDLLEIPNLGSRANAYLGWLVQRYAFGVRDLDSPVTAPGEAPWLFFYAVASFVYRMLVAFAIALLVGTQFFIIGILIAAWSLVLMLVVPLAKHLRFLLAAPVLRRHRGRAFLVTGGALAGLMALLFLLPLPYATVAEGVVWTEGDAALHAGADGLVVALRADPNAGVAPGTPVLELADPILANRARVLEARVSELEAHHAMRDLSDPVRAKITLEELGLARADLALARERLAQLVLRSKAEGRLSLTRPDDLVGRFIRKGDLIGYILRQDDPVIRVVIPESEADLVLQRTRDVALRTASDRATVLPARIERIVPGLQDSLPSPALGTQGGGSISLDPTDPGRARTLGRFLQIDLALPEGAAEGTRFGERVHVRFAHGAEPIANRAWRGLRQVFLKHFGI
jgi:putative peptide zinc metalloprotease protein